MEFTRHAISWFEIPVSDFERAKKFYETIFDYEMPVMDMGDIRMGILLYDRDNQGIGGAICQGEWYKPSGGTGVKVYLDGGKDLSVVLGRIAAAGGTVTLPKTLISADLGYMAFFNDSEGNNIGLFSQS